MNSTKHGGWAAILLTPCAMQRSHGQCAGCTFTLNTLLTGVGWCLPCAHCRDGNIAWTVEVVRKIFQGCVFHNKSLSKGGWLCTYTSLNQKMFPEKGLCEVFYLILFLARIYINFVFIISIQNIRVSVISSTYFDQTKPPDLLPHGAVH